MKSNDQFGMFVICIINHDRLLFAKKKVSLVLFLKKLICFFSFIDALQTQVEELTKLVKSLAKGKEKEADPKDLIIDWSNVNIGTQVEIPEQRLPYRSNKYRSGYGQASSSKQILTQSPELPKSRSNLSSQVSMNLSNRSQSRELPESRSNLSSQVSMNLSNRS